MSVTLALAGLQLAGSYFASQNMKDTAKLNQDIAEMNAEFAELDAYDALVDGTSEKARYQSVIDKTLSSQTANLAAADVDLSFGSAGEIQKETRLTAELNKMEIDKRAQEKALGFKKQGRDYRVQGSLDRSAADTRASSQLFGSALSAASDIAGDKSLVKSISGYF